MATLSSEAVSENKTLFLDAINWYKDEFSHKKPGAEHLDKFSLFPILEDKVVNGVEITGDMWKLLSTVVSAYGDFLRDYLKKQDPDPWINTHTIEIELSKIDKISKDLKMHAAAFGLRKS